MPDIEKVNHAEKLPPTCRVVLEAFAKLNAAEGHANRVRANELDAVTGHLGSAFGDALRQLEAAGVLRLTPAQPGELQPYEVMRGIVNGNGEPVVFVSSISGEQTPAPQGQQGQG
jgi:hypothetical protein